MNWMFLMDEFMIYGWLEVVLHPSHLAAGLGVWVSTSVDPPDGWGHGGWVDRPTGQMVGGRI